MPVGPGELPAFDLDDMPQRYYDHAVVAEEVIWPLVDSYWQGDWRKCSGVGHKLLIQREGRYEWKAPGGKTAKQDLDVHLSAHNVLEEEQEPDAPPVVTSVATMVIEGITRRSLARRLILEQAGHDNFNVTGEYDRDELVTKIATAFSFNTKGNLTICTSQVIEDIDTHEVLWLARNVRGDGDLDSPQLHDHKADVEVAVGKDRPRLLGAEIFWIQKGVAVMDTVGDLHDKIRDIRKNPVNEGGEKAA